MPNNKPTQLSGNVFPSPLQHPEEVTTLRRVRQDKPRAATAPPASPQPGSVKKVTRARHLDIKISRPQKYSTYKKHSTKRQKVKLSIWVDPPEKKELERLAESEGLSLSRTGRAILVDGIRQRLRLEREVLAQPILEAFFDKKMNQVINRLAEFLGRSVYEGGQVRWLFVNTLYREVIHPNKTLTKEEFYNLLDTSQKETLKAVKQWNPNIKDIVAAIKQQLKEGESL